MSDDYVSREAAIKALSHGNGCGHVCKHSIERISAADVVEIVKCKDCEHWMPDGENVMVCTGPMAYCNTDEAWYCAAAKRREANNG